MTTAMQASCGTCGSHFVGTAQYGWTDLRDLYREWILNHRCLIPEERRYIEDEE
jgi:hypothetical protein